MSTNVCRQNFEVPKQKTKYTRKQGVVATTDFDTEWVPFTQDIRNFILESKKNHTLYANSEGFFQRRILSSYDRDTLKDFVYCTLYYNQHAEPSRDEKNHINKVADKIISLNNKYVKDNIHFSVVWVFCYDYSKKETGAIPIFKLYKKAYGDEAAYIDENLKVYDNWDHYIDNGKFPSSLLCIPRYGSYYTVDNTINVEYISKSKMSTYSFGRKNIFKPYFLKTVSPWIEKYTESRSFFDGFVLILCSTIKESWNVLKSIDKSVVICLFSIFMRIKTGGLTEITIKEIIKDLYMLGNKIGDSSRIQNMFNRFSLSSLEILNNLETKMPEDLKKFVNILSDPFILQQLTLLFPNNNYLKALCILFNLFKYFLNLISNRGNPREEFNSSLKDIQPPFQVDVSHQILNKLESNREIMDSVIEKFAFNLDKLKEAPLDCVLDKFYQESANEQSMVKQTRPFYILYTPSPNNGSKDFFIQFYVSLPESVEILKNVLGDRIEKKMINPSQAQVLDSSGIVVGYLFWLEEGHIGGYFSQKKSLKKTNFLFPPFHFGLNFLKQH